MMKYESCQFHLRVFLDGEVPSPLAEELQTHIDQCPNCRSHLEELEDVDAELMGLKRSAAGPARVIASLASHVAVSIAPSSSSNSLERLQPWALVLVIAACILAVLRLRPFPTYTAHVQSIPMTTVAGQLVRATGSAEVLPLVIQSGCR